MQDDLCYENPTQQSSPDLAEKPEAKRKRGRRGSTVGRVAGQKRKRGKDITGLRFSLLTVIELTAWQDKNGMFLWKCRCDCGSVIYRKAVALIHSHCTCCGCKFKEKAARRHARMKSSEYGTWNNMKQRCSNSKNSHYHRYGGRGISVCERWKESFENFLADMGKKPGKEFSLERVNNDGNYEPDNCKWALIDEQSNNKSTNRRIIVDGKSYTLTQAARNLGLKERTLHQRVQLGCPTDVAVTATKLPHGYLQGCSNKPCA